jgi:hypothetical protein
MSLIKLLPLTLLVSCGASDKPQPTPSPSLESEVARIQPMLSKCPTIQPMLSDFGGWYSRPNCDMGDSWTLLAAMARIEPETARLQANASIADDGQPFRSPAHLERFISGNRADDVTANAFSRDHVISLLFYTVWTKDSDPLNRVWDWAKQHDLKVCDGSASQCALTPAVLDQIGDAFAYCGESRPWQTRVPGAASAVVQMISMPSISSWQLTLAAEHVLLKTVTGHLDLSWQELSGQVVRKNPSNLFYKYVDLAANGKDVNELVSPLSILIGKFHSPGKSWFWNDSKDATGYDYILLADLIIKGL